MWNSGKNIPALRYADVLLSYAECLNELGQTAQAVEKVNEVRNRAWGFSIPADKKWDAGMSQDNFRVKILDERMREFLGENWRRADLIRTGKFVEYIKERNKWAKRSGTTQEDQNPGYR